MTPVDPVASALDRLSAWFDANGLAGWDPYDILGDERYRALTVDASGKDRTGFVPRAVRSARHRWPIATRRVLGMKPQVNAKGVGLVLSARLRQHDLGIPGSLERAREAASWLVDHPSAGFPGISWGYPFDWYTRITVPTGTPSAVVTSTIAQALLDHAEKTGDERALDAARGAAVFLSEGLNRTELDDGTFCFSYTPLDDFQVHNASLMAAEYLLRAARAFEVPEWEDLAARAMRFTVNEQFDDGSWEYWAEPQRTVSQIDNYHTGYVLRSLFAFEAAGYAEAGTALERGWDYYERVLLGHGRPNQAPDRPRALDIHSCAESVLCPALFADRFEGALERSREAAEWTIENMRNADGTFIHGEWNGHRRTAPYLRWAEAWMLRALTELLAQEAERAGA